MLCSGRWKGFLPFSMPAGIPIFVQEEPLLEGGVGGGEAWSWCSDVAYLGGSAYLFCHLIHSFPFQKFPPWGRKYSTYHSILHTLPALPRLPPSCTILPPDFTDMITCTPPSVSPTCYHNFHCDRSIRSFIHVHYSILFFLLMFVHSHIRWKISFYHSMVSGGRWRGLSMRSFTVTHTTCHFLPPC